MKRCTRGISTLLAIIIMSACVAIPENPAAMPTPKREWEVSELASALAKLYRVDNMNEIRDRLTDLEECIFHQMASETSLTPEELDTIVIYTVGYLQTAARFTRLKAVEDGELEKDTYYDPNTVIKEEQVVQELDWTIDICYGRE